MCVSRLGEPELFKGDTEVKILDAPTSIGLHNLDLWGLDYSGCT